MRPRSLKSFVRFAVGFALLILLGVSGIVLAGMYENGVNQAAGTMEEGD